GTLDPSGLDGSTGQLVVDASLILAPGSVLDFGLGSAELLDYDSIHVTGDLTLDGTLNVTKMPGFGNGIFTLFTYDGDLFGLENLELTLPFGVLDFSNEGQIDLIYVVPEPSTVALLGLGVLGLLAH